MSPPLATVADLEARIAPNMIDPSEESRIESLIVYASVLVRSYTGCPLDAPDDIPEWATVVVVGMVERSAENREGVTQETAGPFTVSFGSSAAERVFLTAADRVILDANRCSSGFGVISTTRGPVETPTPPGAHDFGDWGDPIETI